jgi:hypothetical protein
LTIATQHTSAAFFLPRPQPSFSPTFSLLKQSPFHYTMRVNRYLAFASLALLASYVSAIPIPDETPVQAIGPDDGTGLGTDSGINATPGQPGGGPFGGGAGPGGSGGSGGGGGGGDLGGLLGLLGRLLGLTATSTQDSATPNALAGLAGILSTTGVSNELTAGEPETPCRR